ncbi:two-component regulator propeller domain-containing protein [Chitinophaga qingshengii]|uniref:two-component regulator propeller domain-containing protein n=1 Tax=Chitinophaga qingshengii TaxID=1569794 RepID=UPI001FE338EC|nr:two-component regulator propeller domain-containing protein [Chitinophaga qingshengii]
MLFVTRVCAAENASLPDSCYVQHFDNTNGLPQNSVKSIVKDASGFIWLATENGLTRFDGAHFTNYERSNTGITSNRFITFLTSPSGELWAYNSNEERLKLLDGKAVRDTLPHKYPRSFYQWYAKDNYQDTGRFYLAYRPEVMLSERACIRKLIYYLDKDSYYECTQYNVAFYEKGTLRYTVPFSSQNRWEFFLLGKRLYYLHKNLTVTLFSSTPQTLELGGEIMKEPRPGNNKKR